jgi:hypothetical protein
MPPARAWAIRTVILGAAIMLFAALFALTVARPARAHGEAAWIMQGETSWCCGEKDCAVVPATRVRVVPGGYFLLDTGETIPEEVAKPSPDGEFWRCRVNADEPNSLTRCFFRGLPGS